MKKIKLICAGLLCFAVMSLVSIPDVHAGGRINFLFSSAVLLEGLQDFNYEGDTTEPDSKSGGGLIFDYIFNERHGLAVDYYLFTETFDGTSLYYGAEDELTALAIGYRYHFPSRFYIGASLLEARLTSTGENALGEGDLVAEFKPTIVPAITAGYLYSFDSGFSFGAHVLYSLPTDLDLDKATFRGETFLDLTLENFNVQNIGFILGYSW